MKSPKQEVPDNGRSEAPRRDAIATSSAPTPTVYPDLIAQNRIDPDAVKVLKRLTRHGYTAYLVGGGVRDLLLSRSPKDFDIATSARPNEVRRLFRNCRIIGRRFRLAHILFGAGKIIEVATFRRDPTQREGCAAVEVFDEDGEQAAFADTDADATTTPALRGSATLWPAPKDRGDDADLLIRQDNTFGLPHEDAIRRDFTINGLFYDLEREEVIDYVGGVRDLREGVVRTIGEPDVRFREDPVRVLRAIKFSARLDLGIAADVYDAMVDLREELSRSAPPRVFEEILRLLRGGAAERSIYLAWDVGALGIVLPELTAHLEDQAEGAELLWDRLRALDVLKAEDRLPSDTVLFAALLHGPLHEAVAYANDPSAAFDDFFSEMNARVPLPRRMRDRMRLIYAAQRRLQRGQVGPLRKRELWQDAAALYELNARAEGRRLPDWLHEPSESAPPGELRRRARRPQAQ
jgi:poly(A) polymerase